MSGQWCRLHPLDAPLNLTARSTRQVNRNVGPQSDLRRNGDRAAGLLGDTVNLA